MTPWRRRFWLIGWEVREAGFIPFGYGIAWRNTINNSVYLLPVPFNRVVAAARSFWWWLLYPDVCYPERVWTEQVAAKWMEGYRTGAKSGLEEGMRKGRQQVLNQLLADIQARESAWQASE